MRKPVKGIAALEASKRAEPVPCQRNRPIRLGLVCVAILALVFAVFGQTLGHQFVNYDDNHYVYENPRITGGLTWNGSGWAFTHVHADNWHPLTTISHMLDCQIYGLHPWGHHLTNILLHALAGILLFFALRELTGHFWGSALVAAIFAIHPLRVSSVAWVSERKDVLSGVFFMLTLWSYARFAQSKLTPRSYVGYVMALVFFALGLMCKPTLVTIPFVLLLLDYWPLRRFTGESSSPRRSVSYLVAEKIPFLAFSLVSCAATTWAGSQPMVPLHLLGVGDRMANVVVSYAAYLGKMIWPTDLAIVYPFPEGGWGVTRIVLSISVLLVISIACLVGRRRYPFCLVGWLWFLGMLIPMIGIIQVGPQSRADRYTYLSQIGLYWIVVWGGLALWSRWRRGRVALIAVAALVGSALIADACIQASYWRDSETMWNQALANTSNNYIAETQIGDALIKAGRFDEAVIHLRQALKINDYYTAHQNLGYALASKGEWADAVVSFRAAIRIRPNYPQALTNLGVSLSKLGRNEEAIAEFEKAIQFDPDQADAHRNLAVLLLQLGQRAEAALHFREALRIKPDDLAVKEQVRQLETTN